MQKINLKGKNSLALQVVMAMGAIGAAWVSTDYVNTRLSALKIHELDQLADRHVVTPKPTFFRAAANARVQAPHDGSSESAFEDVFMSKDEKKSEAEPPPPPIAQTAPTASAILAQYVRVDAVMDNGAIVNSQFIRVGDVVTGLPMMEQGGAAVVVLEGVTRTGARFKANHEPVFIKVANEGI